MYICTNWNIYVHHYQQLSYIQHPTDLFDDVSTITWPKDDRVPDRCEALEEPLTAESWWPVSTDGHGEPLLLTLPEYKASGIMEKSILRC